MTPPSRRPRARRPPMPELSRELSLGRAGRRGATGVPGGGARSPACSSWSSWRSSPGRRPTQRPGRRSSWPGSRFVTGDVWDPANNEYGALAFIYGTVLIVGHRPDPGRAGQHRHRPVHHRGGAPAAASARSSTVIDLLAAVPVGRLRPVGHPRVRPAGSSRFYQNIADAVTGIPVLDSIFGGHRQRRQLHDRRHHPGHHDHPDHHLAQPRGHRHRARAPSARRPTAWAPPAGR